MTDSRQEVFAAADVCSLRCGGARAAALTAGDAAFSAVQAEWTMLVPAVLPYRPGEFFLREPPLRAVLAPVRTLGLLVIDGCADLDPGGRPGLGAHAHAAFGVPVVGVAETRFHAASHAGRLAGQRQVKPAITARKKSRLALAD